MTTPTRTKKRIRCRLGMHKYVLKVNDEARYHECQYCGKYNNNTSGGNGPGGGAF